ncbi:MAG: outer membrane protein transport protein, partial [Pseudomonadota bacterium]|nr:outer membrane protein transport protein [Pseudomonadota bacterium]
VPAAGFFVAEQSVKGLGTSFAGGAAAAEDASTLFHNPAGLTRLTGSEVEVGAYVISPIFDFKNQGTTTPLGTPPTGRVNDGGGFLGFPGNVYYASRLNDDLAVGLGVNSPFGLKTVYNRDWIGRYHAVESEILTVNVNPSLAYRLHPRLSLGAGFNAEYFEARLTNAIDFGSLATLGELPVAQPANPAFDGFSELEADDWGFGYNLGLLWEIDPGVEVNGRRVGGSRVGLSYRSKIDFELDGEGDVSVPAALAIVPDFAAAGGTRGARADVTLPEIASLSGYHTLSPRWSVMADASWFRWSRLDALRVRFADGDVATLPLEWENVWRFAVGVEFRYSDAWTFRAGAAYDESPVPNAELRTPRLPDQTRRWIGVGASYRPWPTLGVDIGYAHQFIRDTAINTTETTTGEAIGVPIGNTLRGRYESQGNVLGVQVQWEF